MREALRVMASSPRPRVSLPDRYSVVRHVANGGMASVWEATDELLGRSVAVKVLSPAFAADEAARRRFTREARAAARLSTHPHVVTVYDAGEHDGQAFMVMALYPGGTVAERIKAGPVPGAHALDWLEDAASALDLAHGEGVVHRDVKPANLLLDASDRVAVADFGIATAAWDTSMTSTGMVLGTLAYLAPEQRAGHTATPASDRYALGLVARELLTGVRPGVEPPNPVRLPGAAEVALMRATSEDPAARPASCAALVEELEAALGGPEGTAATNALPPRPRAPAVPVAIAPPGAGEPTATHAAPVAARPAQMPVPARMPVAARTPVPAREPAPAAAPIPSREPIPARKPSPAREPVAPRGAGGSGGPPAPAGTDGSREGRGAKALVALALVALLLGVGVAVATSLGGDDPTPKRTSTSAKKERQGTATAKSSPSSGSTPAPAPATPVKTSASSTPATTKSRATLIKQNDQAFIGTEGDPAGQVEPLQEAVDGLCTDESDLNCAFALFNLAHALRLADRPGEAIPLLNRRLAISTYKVDAVRQELAAAQQAAGTAPTESSGKGSGKTKGGGKK